MNKEEVKEILSKINYPGFSRDIISFGMVKDIIIENDVIIINLTITSNNVEKIELVSNNIKKELSQFFSSVIVNIKNSDNNKDLSACKRTPRVFFTLRTLCLIQLVGDLPETLSRQILSQLFSDV